MHRFFIAQEQMAGNEVSFSDEQTHQIRHVLRLKTGDHIIVLDNSGWEYELELTKLGKDSAQGVIASKKRSESEPRISITLCQALLKAEKFELVLQKGVELGVSAFVPFISERCVVRKPGEQKVARWRKIIQEAAEQSERARLPVLHPAVSFAEACRGTESPALLLWEEEKSRSLKSTLANAQLRNCDKITVFIGPEGGFPASEVRMAESHGIIPVSIGKRVLRAETAALAAVSFILYQLDELGSA